MNANYIDTHDRPSAAKTPLVRVNRKFFVYGQFTRYIRPGYQIIAVDDPNSIAAYDARAHTVVIMKVSGDSPEIARFKLAGFASVPDTAEITATTTAPDDNTPDWKQHGATLMVQKRGRDGVVEASLYPKSVYTLALHPVWR
jgi:hypothetical protein